MENSQNSQRLLSTQHGDRCRGRHHVVNPHTQPITYFQTYYPTTTPEIDFNHTTYYPHPNALTDGNNIKPEEIRKELVADVEDQVRVSGSTVLRVMRLPNGEIRPAYLPLLSDLRGYMHRGVSVFVEWFYGHHDFEADEVVPKEIVPIFALTPTFDAEATHTYALQVQQRHVFVGAETIALHVMRIDKALTAIQLNVFSSVTNRSGIRYHRVSICGDQPDPDSTRPNLMVGSFVLVWNANDIHRSSFKDNFRVLYECYNPMLVILTEARPRGLQLHDVLSELPGNYQIQGTGSTGVGGVVLLWDKNAEPYFRKRSCTLHDQKLSVEIMSGPAIDPPLPFGEGISDCCVHDSYDYIGNWLLNSGLDDDPSIHDEGWC